MEKVGRILTYVGVPLAIAGGIMTANADEHYYECVNGNFTVCYDLCRILRDQSVEHRLLPPSPLLCRQWLVYPVRHVQCVNCVVCVYSMEKMVSFGQKFAEKWLFFVFVLRCLCCRP